jgi:hypothetical protein
MLRTTGCPESTCKPVGRHEYCRTLFLAVKSYAVPAADFFISALNTRLLYIIIGIFVVYLVVFFFFAIFWYIAGQ